jgi:hypothetical protein
MGNSFIEILMQAPLSVEPTALPGEGCSAGEGWS